MIPNVFGVPTYKIVELLGDVDAHVRRIKLVWLPDEEYLEDLGEVARHFGIKEEIDGDALLAPVSAFSENELNAVLAADAEIMEGYEFDYPQSEFVAPLETWMKLKGWCGNTALNTGYSLFFDVAVVVCALSFARAKGIQIFEKRRKR
jgi:hypothetical protein